MLIGFYIFDGMTLLDMVGPHEVLSQIPHAETVLFSHNGAGVTTENGLKLGAQAAIHDVGPLDVLVVPGGPGIDNVLTDIGAIDAVRRLAEGAKYITSVCTGALILGAAGLLKNRRATTHWTAKDFLIPFGAIFVSDRVVCDGSIITGAGVTAGIDFGLTLAAKIVNERTACRIQLMLEYDPAPPFFAGNPDLVDQDIKIELLSTLSERRSDRAQAVQISANRLS